MSSRPILSPQSVITNASMAASVTSLVTIVQTNGKVSYDISWTGTPVGTFNVQVSNTYSQNAAGQVSNPGNWTTLTTSSNSPPAATGSAGNGFIDIDATGAYAVRLIYTAASGTGVLNATVAGKV